MKTRASHSGQYGFFEIGFGLLLTVIFGGATLVAVEISQKDESEQVASYSEEQQVSLTYDNDDN